MTIVFSFQFSTFNRFHREETKLAPILQVKNLQYIYSVGTPFQHTALEDVSFELERGEFVGIIGHTGSGKSTMIQHLK